MIGITYMCVHVSVNSHKNFYVKYLKVFHDFVMVIFRLKDTCHRKNTDIRHYINIIPKK